MILIFSLLVGIYNLKKKISSLYKCHRTLVLTVFTSFWFLYVYTYIQILFFQRSVQLHFHLNESCGIDISRYIYMPRVCTMLNFDKCCQTTL